MEVNQNAQAKKTERRVADRQLERLRGASMGPR